jgi:hypothetical protein
VVAKNDLINEDTWAKLGGENDNILDERMRQLQHLLLELMEVLDLKQSGIPSEYGSVPPCFSL